MLIKKKLKKSRFYHVAMATMRDYNLDILTDNKEKYIDSPEVYMAEREFIMNAFESIFRKYNLFEDSKHPYEVQLNLEDMYNIGQLVQLSHGLRHDFTDFNQLTFAIMQGH